jgi:hypothetical protein
MPGGQDPVVEGKISFRPQLLAEPAASLEGGLPFGQAVVVVQEAPRNRLTG